VHCRLFTLLPTGAIASTSLEFIALSVRSLKYSVTTLASVKRANCFDGTRVTLCEGNIGYLSRGLSKSVHDEQMWPLRGNY
jgi:hypothetical protein